MHVLKPFLPSILICLSFFSCHSSQSVLKVSDIPGYDRDNNDHILFLNLKISEGRPEKVRLVKANSGKGKMKDLRQKVNYPFQIQVIPRYGSNHLETEMVFEHPLYRLAEAPNQDGTLSKSQWTEKDGILNVRIQADRTMERIEFYSVTPERGKVKIYTLNVNQ